ncbi:MAG: TolC family protein [Armatimonadota bacterium]
MIWAIVSVVLSVALAGALALPGSAQTGPAAPRRISFADVATAVTQGNLQLRAAAFDVAVAEAQLAQARGGRLPQLTVTGSYARSQDRPGQSFSFTNPFGPTPPVITVMLPAPDPNAYAVRLALQFPLYTGGRIESQIALAEANLRGARATFGRTRQQVLFAAQQLYLQGLLAQENVASARRALDQASESVRVAEARVSAGAAAQLDVLQADVAAANAEQSMVRARTSVASAQTSLDAALNLPQDTLLEYTDTLEPRPVGGTLQDAIARALRERPDLADIQNRIAAAQASIALAESGGRPVVSLGAGYDLNNSNGQTANINGSWSATLAVTLSLYDGGITRERVREARFRLEQLKVLEAQRRQQVELEVRQAWLLLDQASGELAAAGKAVEQGREAARIAAVRYGAGVGTSLEVLSAQATLSQAELALASARFNQNLTRFQLMLATGSL